MTKIRKFWKNWGFLLLIAIILGMGIANPKTSSSSHTTSAVPHPVSGMMHKAGIQ